MKSISLLALALFSLVFVVTMAYGEGNVERGKALFNDPKLGTTGKSCGSCHPDGKGLEQAGTKKEFNIMGKSQKSLEEAVNFCIENALKGKALDPKGKDIADIVAYIKSLSGKAAPKKKKAIEGC
jgi:mono/diheme cytochrome c family protein